MLRRLVILSFLITVSLSISAATYDGGDCSGHLLVNPGGFVRFTPGNGPSPDYLWILVADGGGAALLQDGLGNVSYGFTFHKDDLVLFDPNLRLDLYYQGTTPMEFYYGGALLRPPNQPVCGAATIGPLLILSQGEKLVGVQSAMPGPPFIRVYRYGTNDAVFSGSIRYRRLGSSAHLGDFDPEACSGGSCCDPLDPTFPAENILAGSFTGFLVLSLEEAPIDWDMVESIPLVCEAEASPTTGNTPLLVTFTASAAGGSGGNTFTWDFGDGDAAEGTEVTHKYKKGGTFDWALKVKDFSGTRCDKSGTITAVSPLTVSASGLPRSGNPPLTVQFEAEAQGGTPPYEFEWNFGDGETGHGPFATHTYENAKKYIWTMVAIDAEGKTNAATGEVFCGVPVDPTVTQVLKAGGPFRLKVMGTDFMAGCRVLIDGVQAPETAHKNSTKVVAKKGQPLKDMVPKGQSVCIRVENPDGGLSPCFLYTR